MRCKIKSKILRVLSILATLPVSLLSSAINLQHAPLVEFEQTSLKVIRTEPKGNSFMRKPHAVIVAPGDVIFYVPRGAPFGKPTVVENWPTPIKEIAANGLIYANGTLEKMSHEVVVKNSAPKCLPPFSACYREALELIDRQNIEVLHLEPLGDPLLPQPFARVGVPGGAVHTAVVNMYFGRRLAGRSRPVIKAIDSRGVTVEEFDKTGSRKTTLIKVKQL